MKAKYLWLVACLILGVLAWKHFVSKPQSSIAPAPSVATTNMIATETNVVIASGPAKATPPESPLTNSVHKVIHTSAAISSDGKATPTDVRQKPAMTNNF
jgi:hypothetical protein